MNEIARVEHNELISVLQSSLYPGAKAESIELVLSYCRANGLDPMLKPVHIVPQRVKENGQWVSRDTLMPGIADYRIKASRTGEYVGKSEPEFGPDVSEKLGGVSVTYPKWCRITVHRWVRGEARAFVANELWLENYATKDRETVAPNYMWQKRPYGQIAKCAEAQALRMAFPEFSGGQPTAEEMEGKSGFGYADEPAQVQAEVVSSEPPRAVRVARPAPHEAPQSQPSAESAPTERTREQWDSWLDRLRQAAAACTDHMAVASLANRPSIADAMMHAPQVVRDDISDLLGEAYKLHPMPAPDAPSFLDEVEAAEADGWPGPKPV